MKNVVIISSSMRKGNSDKLCDEFEKGAKENNTVIRINLRDINLKFCISCCDCYNIGKCSLDDDMNALYEKIKEADIIVFATPIYFGEMSGQLKTFLDRLYPIYQNLKVKEAYVIATCYQNSKAFIEDSIIGIKRFLTDVGVELKAVIYGENTDEIGDVSLSQCQRSYDIGKRIQ